MKFHNHSLRQAVLLMAAGLLSGGSALAAVTFNVTPSVISNTYGGAVTLQISNLSSGDTVLIQKYLDANSNGIVDAGDLLSQQFKLIDGQANLFTNGGTLVTNLNLPGDIDGVANGQITAQLYLDFDFAQLFVGKYLFVLSSPAGHFTSITNSFTVTNFPFGQTISGTVTNNGSAVPNAIVLLFQPSGGGENPAGGVVANNSGAYTISAPTGTYTLAAFKSNYVANLNISPDVTLGAGSNITTNVPVTSATTTISGKVIDTNTSAGLPGMLLPFQTTNNYLAVAQTDTNGNFSAGVLANSWKVQPSSQSTSFYGYVKNNNDGTKVNTTGGSVAGVSIALTKGTAIFYGNVKDNLGNPMTGLDVEGDDNVQNGDGQYSVDAYTDVNGNYFAYVVAGDAWEVYVNSADQKPAYTNYAYSQADSQQNGGDSFTTGQAAQQNFTAIQTPYQITGYVQNSLSNGIGSLGVNATATIASVNYQVHVDTANNGTYNMNVAAGDWDVSVNCGDGGDGLVDILGNGNFQCPNDDNVNIVSGNGTANFTVGPCNGPQILTASLPGGTVNSYYDFFLSGSTCNGNLNWSLNDPQDFPGTFTFNSDGEIFGTPASSGTYNFTVNLSDGNGDSTNQSLSLTINAATAPLQVTTASLPNGTNGAFYSQTLQASGGQTPYTWSLEPGSASLPSNLALGTNGLISGVPTVMGTNLEFIVQVTDADENIADQTLALTIVSSPNPPGLPLTLIRQPGNGLLEFTFSSSSGVNYSVQTSADLIHWTTILSFTGEGGQETISAPTTGGSARTFYRVKIGP